MGVPALMPTVALIGFGEAGSILGADLVRAGCTVAAYDLLIHDASARSRLEQAAAAAHVVLAASLADALRGVELVISAVTASACVEVATGATPWLAPGSWLLDINSASPASKQRAAAVVEAAGGRYVEAAVMAAIPPQRLATPMLLGGASAALLAPRLQSLGMSVTVASEAVGVASAIKLCRSIMIKGLEALTVECLFAARHFAAEEQVLASLHQTFPHMGWLGGQGDYLVSRVAEHGRRRAAELREVAAMLQSIGQQPFMARATAQRQDDLVRQMAALGVPYPREAPFSWRALCDRLGDQRSGDNPDRVGDNPTSAGC
jgi:3-hydroxyisobutyrate dehydrogenase-like beta-hydroxyacid dehydrogenase